MVGGLGGRETEVWVGGWVGEFALVNTECSIIMSLIVIQPHSGSMHTYYYVSA